MCRKVLIGFLILCFGAINATTLAGELESKQKEGPSKLKAHLIAKQSTYELDPETNAANQINQLLIKQNLEITLVLQNPTAKDIKVIINPDDDFDPQMGISVELKGPRVVPISSPRSPQKFAQFAYTITIPAGKSVEHGISLVWGGKRQWHSV